jgi:hypothetical protein
MTQSIEQRTPRELFHDLIHQAMEHQKLDSSEDSCFYLMNLLDEFVRPERRFAALGMAGDEALAELYCRAVAEAGPRRLTLLRLTGDTSLFLAGFFPDSLGRRAVGMDYTIRLGGSAYGTAAGECRNTATAELFDELAAHFVRFVDVLAEVSEQCSLRDDNNLLRLYQQWQESGSPRTATLLRRAGVVLSDDGEVH